MGEKQTKPFQLSFNGSLKVDFQGSHVTSDGGLILVRELDERLGLASPSLCSSPSRESTCPDPASRSWAPREVAGRGCLEIGQGSRACGSGGKP